VALPGCPTDELPDALSRWSRLAFASVGALVLTGAFQTGRQVGSLDAFTGTDFGRILLVKLACFAGLLVLAMFGSEISHKLAPREPDVPPVPEVAGRSDDVPIAVEDDEAGLRTILRRSVLVELAVAGAVLVATALLVNAAPSTSDAASVEGAVGVTLRSEQVWVDVTAAPGQPGRNDIHVSALTPDGAPIDVSELTVTFALPARGIAPIDVPLRRLGPGHYLSPGFDLPIGGKWKIVAKPLLGEFEQPTLTGTLKIGS
jgi:copper transport protein